MISGRVLSFLCLTGAALYLPAQADESGLNANVAIEAKAPLKSGASSAGAADGASAGASNDTLAGAAIISKLLDMPVADTLPPWYSKVRPQTSQVAAMVLDMNSGKLLLSDNSERAMLPASVQKLFLATAATLSLGNDFRFLTRLYGTGHEQDALQALYLVMDGSPVLSSSELGALFGAIKASGINKIDTLYLVNSEHEPVQARGWAWDDLRFCYASPVSNLTLDKNCVKGTLYPNKNGTAVSLKLAKDAGIEVTNDIQYRPTLPAKDCQPELSSLGNNQFRLWGCYSGKDPLPLAFAISDSAQWLSGQAKKILISKGLTVDRIAMTTALPEGAVLLASHKSPPLPELVKALLKESDNLISDALLKRIGDKELGKADFVEGSKAMATLLSSRGVALSGAVLLDGSGLSRYNLINARQLMSLLALIYQTPELNSLIDALPVSGRDGTLAYRRFFNREPLKGKVMAKTGTMSGVANLAGFIKEKDTTYGFVILENGLVPQRDDKGRKTGQVFSAELLKALLVTETNMAKKKAPEKQESKNAAPKMHNANAAEPKKP